MKNIVKKYGDGFPAVNDVSIDVKDGEFMILVGPSGCGKSTLLRMVVGLEDITSGDMVIGGDRVNDKAPRERNLAMVFQNYALYPHLTVFENIAFPLRLSKQFSEKEIQRRCTRPAGSSSSTSISSAGRRTSPAASGSGSRWGGRSSARPQAFLFDEPLSNLDAKLRGQMRTEISRLQRRLGITTVYVTHDQTEAMTLGDRVAVLKRGILQQLATPRELYEHPNNLFVAGFIGSPPMNFLPATVEGDTVSLPFGTVRIPPEKAELAQGKGLLIAGIRPEHFDDAAVVEPHRLEHGSTFRARVDVTEWLGNEAYAYIPIDLPRGDPDPADRSGARARHGGAATAAGRLARRRQPDRGGRGGRDLRRRSQDAPLRPGVPGEPHRRPLTRTRGRPRLCDRRQREG